MSLLNSKFDILRGYPNGSALVWPFAIKTTGSPPVAVALPGGTIVTQELQGTQTVVAVMTSPNVSTHPPKEPWLVVEGNDDFSGQFVRSAPRPSSARGSSSRPTSTTREPTRSAPRSPPAAARSRKRRSRTRSSATCSRTASRPRAPSWCPPSGREGDPHGVVVVVAVH